MVIFFVSLLFLISFGKGRSGGGGGKKISIPKKYNYPVVYFGLS